MLNPFKEVNWNPGRKEKRKFALSLMIGFPCIAAILLLGGRIGSGHWKLGLGWLAGIGFGAGLILWLLPVIARPFYLVWYFASCCMGIVIGNVLLASVYYLVLTPVGLVMRLFGRLSLRKGFDRSRKSYWEEGRKEVDLKSYYRQF